MRARVVLSWLLDQCQAARLFTVATGASSPQDDPGGDFAVTLSSFTTELMRQSSVALPSIHREVNFPPLNCGEVDDFGL